MALSAVLEFGDNNINRYSKRFLVTDCRIEFARPYNDNRPEGAARCKRVEISVVASGKEDHTLFEWFASRSVQNGRLVISLLADGKVVDGDTHVLAFESGQCYSLSEFYDIDLSKRRLLKIGIIADSMTIDSVSFNRI